MALWRHQLLDMGLDCTRSNLKVALFKVRPRCSLGYFLCQTRVGLNAFNKNSGD
jgi:hypothetical protein